MEPSKSFLDYLLKTKDISNVPAIKYGIENESVAIKEYEKEFGYKVAKCGIFLDSCGFLGGSPDGLVGNDGIIEVKCPFQMKNTTSITDFNRLGYLKKNDENKFEVNTSHKYYHQIQGNLYLTKRKHCDFVVWKEQGTIHGQRNHDNGRDHDFTWVRVVKFRLPTVPPRTVSPVLPPATTLETGRT